MNKKQIISSVQSLLNSGRKVITVMHVQVARMKAEKKAADAEGNQEVEYFYHNMLQKQRAALRQEVKNQKALKVILKELQYG